jgi:hypothetical protein
LCRALTLRLAGLEDWLGHGPIRQKTIGRFADQLEVYVPVVEVESVRLESRRASIDIGFSTNVTPGREFVLKRRYYFRIVSDIPQPCEFHSQLHWNIHCLLVVLSGAKMTADQLAFTTCTEDGDDSRKWKTAHQYARHSGSPAAHAKREPTDFLIRYCDVKGMWGSLVTIWLDLCGKVNQSIYTLVHDILEPPVNLEARFLTLIQSFEGFSQCTAQIPEKLSEREYRALKNAIENAIPENTDAEIVSMLKQTLGSLKRPSLADRMRHQCSSMSHEVQRLFCIERDEFIRGVVAARNYLTHQLPRKPTAALDGIDELYVVCEKMQIMLAILYLRELTVEESNIIGAVNRFYKSGSKQARWNRVREC